MYKHFLNRATIKCQSVLQKNKVCKKSFYNSLGGMFFFTLLSNDL